MDMFRDTSMLSLPTSMQLWFVRLCPAHQRRHIVSGFRPDFSGYINVDVSNYTTPSPKWQPPSNRSPILAGTMMTSHFERVTEYYCTCPVHGGQPC